MWCKNKFDILYKDNLLKIQVECEFALVLVPWFLTEVCLLNLKKKIRNFQRFITSVNKQMLYEIWHLKFGRLRGHSWRYDTPSCFFSLEGAALKGTIGCRSKCRNVLALRIITHYLSCASPCALIILTTCLFSRFFVFIISPCIYKK